MKDNSFEKITVLNVSYRSLEIAQDRLHLDRLPKFQQDRLQLIQGSLTYRDQRLKGYDAATLIEVYRTSSSQSSSDPRESSL